MSRQSRRAALKAQQEAEARAGRRKKVIGVVAGVVVVAVAAVAVVVGLTGRGSEPTAVASATGAQVAPPHGDASTGAITPITGKAPSSAPVFTVYSDFQCPWCKVADDGFGQELVQLAQQGRITLRYRTVTFLESNFKNDWSTRAAEAAADADAVGAYTQYYAAVYANQPQQEGAGYTDQQLRVDFPKQAGITGDRLAKFQKLYATRASQTFVKRAATTNEASIKQVAGQLSTPTFAVNGKNWTAWQGWYDQNSGQWTKKPTAQQLLSSINSAA